MTAPDPTSVNATLLQRAERLVRDFKAVPAGSVLRCFARAVGDARRTGCDLAALPDLAEDRARRMLADRAPGNEPGANRR